MKSKSDRSDLLLLGRQLAEIAPELKRMRAWVDELEELFNAEIEKSSTWPDDQKEWSRWDAQAYYEARCRVEKETEIGKAFVRALRALEAVDARTDPLCTAIRTIVPCTVKGKMLKRWASAIQLGYWPNHPAAIQRELNYCSCK